MESRFSKVDSMEAASFDSDMADYPAPKYSIDEVRNAGAAIAAGLVWPDDETDSSTEDIRRVFRVAHNWRESHGWPLRRIRHKLMGRIKATETDGFTAARVKRMASIRPKLIKGFRLDKIQDLGGCRCVLGGMDDLERLLNESLPLSCFEVLKQDDYINKPKESGYRSHHVIVKYRGISSEAAYNNLRIEIQFRTELQHTWATANEAVGLYKGQKLKSGQGDPKWLRFFALMSSEISCIEGLPTIKNAPQKSERVEEIKALNDQLNARDLLSACASAFKEITDNSRPADPPQYWLVTYHAARREVEVRPYRARNGFAAYERAERLEEESVLIDSTKLENLRKEFPNYFGDVRLFQKILASICGGEDLADYAHKLNRVSIVRQQEKIDDRWLRRQGKGRQS